MSTLVRVTQRLVPLHKPAITELLQHAKALSGFADWNVGCQVTGSTTIARLNRFYRHKRGPTDCLSFTAVDWARPEVPQPGPADDGSSSFESLRDLGDMVLAADVIESDAARLGADREAHWRLILVHSLVHLMGHDHETEEQAAVMEPRVEGLLGQLAGMDLPRITQPGPLPPELAARLKLESAAGQTGTR